MRTSDAIFALSSTWLHDGFHDCLNFMTPPHPHTSVHSTPRAAQLGLVCVRECASSPPPPPPPTV